MSPTIDDEKLANWYDFQARFYHLWRDDYDSPVIEMVAQRLGSAEESVSILDAGCGTGLFAVGLARTRPNWRVEGLDASAGMLDIARRQADRFGLSNVEFRKGDAAALPFDDGSLDAVVAAGLFPNLNDRTRPLEEFFRVLRPGGGLVAVEVDRDALSPAMRGLFRMMILGYRLFSAVVPRFRFAKRWSLQSSTVDPGALARDAGSTGFDPLQPQRHGSHLVLEFKKRAS